MGVSNNYIPNPRSADAGAVEPEDFPIDTYSRTPTPGGRLPAMKSHTRGHNRLHRKYASMVMLSLLFLLSNRCEIMDNGSEGDVMPIILFPSQDEFNTYYENMPKDSVTILNREITGDILLIEVQYLGGCEEHNFELIAADGINKSNPPQLPVFLGHNNGNDPCEELQVETLFFDLKPLRQKWFSGDYGNMDVLILRLNDEPMDNWLTDRSMWLIR